MAVPDDGKVAKRALELDRLYKDFVSKSEANKKIFRYILEALWIEGEDLPGPVVSRDEVRAAVNIARRRDGASKDYLDVFRRLRELQGEEGFLDLVKVGSSYQLRSIEVATKRIPRSQISAEVWNRVLDTHGNACAVCGVAGGNDSSHLRLVPDHRVPRSRLNEDLFRSVEGDSVENIQPLCQNCNIQKSVSCRGCDVNCFSCPWMNPKEKPMITLRGGLLDKIVERAEKRDIKPQELVEEIISSALEEAENEKSSGV